MATILPTGKEPRLPDPIGGPHVLFDGSFIIEFLQPPEGLDASVLMKSTYVGGHAHLELGKKHPQAPPLHIHFSQSESFLVLSGAAGTTSTYETIDTVHTPHSSTPQQTPSRRPIPPLPARDGRGVVHIPPYTPHNFWPIGPNDPFWSTPQGKAQEVAAGAQGRNMDTVFLIWAHPRINLSPSGRYDASFPPDMDAVFFLALLAMVDGVFSKRISMDLSNMGMLFAMQHESDSAMVMMPNWSVLGPLRWWVPWVLFKGVSAVRGFVGGGELRAVAEGMIEREVVKRL